MDREFHAARVAVVAEEAIAAASIPIPKSTALLFGLLKSAINTQLAKNETKRKNA